MPETWFETVPELVLGEYSVAKSPLHLAIVREAVANLGWGSMVYRCEDCSFEWRVWLALGVEGPSSLRDAGCFVPSPFTTRCFAWPRMRPCPGPMTHIDWNRDETFESRLIPETAPRFVLPATAVGSMAAGHLETPEPALVLARRWGNDEHGGS